MVAPPPFTHPSLNCSQIADVVRHADTSESLVRTRTLTPAVKERYVVAVGTVTERNLKARLHEIFHLDHGKHKVNVVRVSQVFFFVSGHFGVGGWGGRLFAQFFGLFGSGLMMIPVEFWLQTWLCLVCFALLFSLFFLSCRDFACLLLLKFDLSVPCPKQESKPTNEHLTI